jgi:hypothetical protein
MSCSASTPVAVQYNAPAGQVASAAPLGGALVTGVGSLVASLLGVHHLKLNNQLLTLVAMAAVLFLMRSNAGASGNLSTITNLLSLFLQ